MWALQIITIECPDVRNVFVGKTSTSVRCNYRNAVWSLPYTAIVTTGLDKVTKAKRRRLHGAIIVLFTSHLPSDHHVPPSPGRLFHVTSIHYVICVYHVDHTNFKPHSLLLDNSAIAHEIIKHNQTWDCGYPCCCYSPLSLSWHCTQLLRRRKKARKLT